MALKELLTDLSKFKYTNYKNVGANNSPIGGRHGGTEGPTPAQPPHPEEHSKFDDGVGFGVAPSDNPQSFNVRGYTVTGNKRFYIGWQGDIMNHPLSDYGIGAFNSIAGVFDHTQTRDKLRKVYENYDSIEFGVDGSVHVGDQDLAGVVGGGLSYYGSLVSIIPRGSIYRAGDGTYRVPQEGVNTLPPGGISGIPEFTGTQITHNIPQIILTGPFGDEDYQSTLRTTPLIPNAHGSDFMTTPIGDSVLPSNTVTHIVDMITLSGPTSQNYHRTLNTIPIATGAHGSDFQTTPIEAYSSIFATQDGLLMDTIYDSGFNRSGMYIANQTEQSIPEFKEFSRTDTSLKRISLDSPNFDSDGNKEFGFKDRVPYNIPARDNTVFGFDQPFILKDIGDRWGPGGLGAIDEGLFRGGFVTSAARTVADVLRIGKFILTPKGIMFGLKQAGLQLLNPRKETTIWNPLSLVGSVAPMVHMDRHFGTATEGFGYESVINFGLASVGKRMNSILFAYGSAVNLQGGNIPALAAVTATRVTGAHIVGMVPSAGGVPGTFPSIPEIDIDLIGGNITSLTAKPSNKYGPKTLLGNKKYTVSDGTPIIPARNPEAGFKSGILGGRFAGSQLTQMFLSEDGLFPSEALTDAVIGNKFKGDQWGEDKSGGVYEQFAFTNIGDRKYVQLFGGGDLITGALTVKTHADDKHDVFGTEPIQGTIVIPQFSLTKDMARPFQTPIFKTNVFEGDYYNKEKNYLSTELTNQKGHYQIYGSGVISRERNNVIIPGGSVVSINHPTIQTQTLALNGRSITQYTPIRLKRIVSGNTGRINFLGENKYGDTNVLEDTKESYVPTLILGNKKDGLLIPTDDQRNKLFTSKTYWGTSVISDTFKSDLYDKDKTYESQISSFGIVSSPPTLTRLKTDADGDPTVTIKTSHPESDPNVVRLSAEGKYKNGLEDIKLQDFPLINFTGTGNLGAERQSLGFVNKEITGLQGNLFGIPGKTRSGFGVLDNKKYTEIITIDGIVKGTLQGKDTDGTPKVEKDLAYEHKFAPEGISDKLYAAGEKFTPDFKTVKTPTNLGSTFSTKTKGFPGQTGNILDKYKTLAYGDIPTVEKPDERYSKKIVVRQNADKKEYEHYDAKEGDTTGGSSAVVVIDPDLGLIKKTTVEGGDYITDLVDKVNMYKYQDNDVGETDSIKFKFKDIVNSKYIIFKAYLSGISEALSPEWSSEKYIGRPDSVHVYQGVERSISFEFTVAPNTKQELPILWEKMNYLVGLTYPSWRSVGTGKRMEAPFINLTIGDMYVDTPGFLSSLSITIDDNSPWELDDGFQLPHAISVSCEFTHIGKHALASQGTHFDFGGKDKTWLKPYNVGTGKMEEARLNGWDETGLFGV